MCLLIYKEKHTLCYDIVLVNSKTRLLFKLFQFFRKQTDTKFK